MMNFTLFTKDDYGVLFEGFETSFLQLPFKHPTKAITRLAPKGFRIDKLNRSQMIKVFTDAIQNGEMSIHSFVSKEIEAQFEAATITSFIESHKENLDYLLGVGIASVSSLLWKKGLRIPAYIVYLLFGINPSDSCKKESMLLYNTFCNEIEKHGKDKFKEGVQNVERKNRNAIESETKRVDRLEKSLAHAKEQKDEAEDKINIANKERDEAISVAEARAERIKEAQDTIDRLEKEVTQATYAVKRAEKNLIKMQELEDELAEKQNECKKKDNQITRLTNELSKAHDMAYTEEVLQHLCAEVLDELSARSLGSQEILRIAKKRFSDEETVLAGWESLSEESNELIKKIVNQFSSGTFSMEQFDVLEKMEDGILIRYAVTKALKAILYNALEKQESEATIGERFSGKENA